MKKSVLSLVLLLSLTASISAAPAVERLEGEQASEHLSKLKAEESELFRKAAARMEARGYKPTDIVTVVKSKQKDVEKTQDSFANSDGEIVIWAWDDGDNSTFEGTVYFENYGAGTTAVYDVQMSIVDEPVTVWSEYVGGTGYDKRDAEMWQAFKAKDSAAPQIAAMGEFNARRDIELIAAPPDWQGFATCARWSCAAFRAGCTLTGPYWARCYLIGCGASVIGCGLIYLR